MQSRRARSPISTVRRFADSVVVRTPAPVRGALKLSWVLLVFLAVSYAANDLPTLVSGQGVIPPVVVYLVHHALVPFIAAIVVVLALALVGAIVQNSDKRREENEKRQQEDPRQQYLRAVEERYASLLRLLRLTDPQLPPVLSHSLEQVHGPRVYDRPGMLRILDRRQRTPGTAAPTEASAVQRKTIKQAIKQTPRMIILGNADVGKSDILRELMLQAAIDARKDPEAPLPIFISVHELQHSNEPILSHLTTVANNMGLDSRCAEILREAVSEGNAYLCLDDLQDDTEETQRSGLAMQSIYEALRQEGLACVLTMSDAKEDPKASELAQRLGRFAQWRIAALDERRRKELAQQVLDLRPADAPRRRLRMRHTRGTEPTDKMVNKFLGELDTLRANHPDVAEAVLRNQLFFSLSALSYMERRQLFENVADLHRYAIETILKRENDVIWTSYILRELPDLARRIRQQNLQSFNLDDDLIPLFVDDRGRPVSEVEELVNRLVRSEFVEEAGEQSFQFRYRSYLAYLTASSLAHDIAGQNDVRKSEAWSIIQEKHIKSAWVDVFWYLSGAFAQQRSPQGVESAHQWMEELSKRRFQDHTPSDPGDLELGAQLRFLADAAGWDDFNRFDKDASYWSACTDWGDCVLQAARERHFGRLGRLFHLAPDLARLYESGDRGKSLLDESKQRLYQSLDDPSEPVRVAAILALGHFATSSDLPDGVLARLNDPSWAVFVAAAAVACANTGCMQDARILAALRARESHPNSFVRHTASEALALCEDANSERMVTAALDHLLQGAVRLPGFGGLLDQLLTEDEFQFDTIMAIEPLAVLVEKHRAHIAGICGDESEAALARALASILVAALRTENDQEAADLLRTRGTQDPNQWVRIVALVMLRWVYGMNPDQVLVGATAGAIGLQASAWERLTVDLLGLMDLARKLGSDQTTSAVSPASRSREQEVEEVLGSVLSIVVPAIRELVGPDTWSKLLPLIKPTMSGLAGILSSISRLHLIQPLVLQIAEDVDEQAAQSGDGQSNETPEQKENRRRNELRRDVDLLTKALGDSSVWVRGEAVVLLAGLSSLESRSGSWSHQHPIVPLGPLKSRVGSSQEEDSVRMIALCGLCVIGYFELTAEGATAERVQQRVPTRFLSSLLRDRSALVRVATILAFWVLGGVDYAVTQDRSQRMLPMPESTIRRMEVKDTNRWVQLVASLVLHDTAGLTKKVREESDEIVRSAAAACIGILAVMNVEDQKIEKETLLATGAGAAGVWSSLVAIASVAAAGTVMSQESSALDEELLTHVLERGDTLRRAFAVLVLGTRNAACVERTARCLREDASAWVRGAAAGVLAAIYRPPQAIDSPEGQPGQDGGSPPVPTSSAALAGAALRAAAEEDADPWVRAIAVAAVSQGLSVAGIGRAVTNPGWAVRLAALLYAEDRLEDEQLATLVEDPNAGIRVAAVLALASRHSRQTRATDTVVLESARNQLRDHPALEYILAACLGDASEMDTRQVALWPLGLLSAIDRWAEGMVGDGTGPLRAVAVGLLGLLSPLHAGTVQTPGERQNSAELRKLRDADPDTTLRSALAHILELRDLGADMPAYPESSDPAGQVLFELSALLDRSLHVVIPLLQSSDPSASAGSGESLRSLMHSGRWDVQLGAAELAAEVSVDPKSWNIERLRALWSAGPSAVHQAADDALARILPLDLAAE